MVCKEEEDEVSLLFVNGYFYGKHDEVFGFIDKHPRVSKLPAYITGDNRMLSLSEKRNFSMLNELLKNKYKL
jgi:hypothetical protein